MVLALNRHYVVVQVISVPRAFTLLVKGSAEVLSVEEGHFQSFSFHEWQALSLWKRHAGRHDETDDWVRSVRDAIQVPRIVRLLSYDRVPRNIVKFSRKNVFLRDEHCCQYCQRHFPRNQLSLDHVLPRSRGGVDSWENVVCACLTCNVRKGGRTPQEAGMKLSRTPSRPVRNPLLTRQLGLRKYACWQTFVRPPH
jgi:5-methylcytosine-specific restriction endonuclease McrA